MSFPQQRSNEVDNKITLFGVKIDNLSLSLLLEKITESVKSANKTILSYTNIHGLNLAFEQPEFRELLNRADLVFCDGFGVILGARLTRQKLDYRFTPPDWIGHLCELCVREGFSLFLLGARPGVAEKAAARLSAAYSGLQIVGTQHGYFDKTQGSAENEVVAEMINHTKPNILIVGFGMPKQEQWIRDNFDRLEVNVFLPVGAALDYAAGEVQRAPRWMTDHGLEWLGRLVIEPRRLWRRYLIGIPLFSGALRSSV